MKKDDSVFLRHILEAIELVEAYIEGKSFTDFENYRMLQDAVIREIEIIGEAAKNVSTKIKDKYSQIPWRQMSGMRDKLIHGYFGVDLAAVWDTATRDIILLKKHLYEILEKEIK